MDALYVLFVCIARIILVSLRAAIPFFIIFRRRRMGFQRNSRYRPSLSSLAEAQRKQPASFGLSKYYGWRRPGDGKSWKTERVDDWMDFIMDHEITSGHFMWNWGGEQQQRLTHCHKSSVVEAENGKRLTASVVGPITDGDWVMNKHLIIRLPVWAPSTYAYGVMIGSSARWLVQ